MLDTDFGRYYLVAQQMGLGKEAYALGILARGGVYMPMEWWFPRDVQISGQSLEMS